MYTSFHTSNTIIEAYSTKRVVYLEAPQILEDKGLSFPSLRNQTHTLRVYRDLLCHVFHVTHQSRRATSRVGFPTMTRPASALGSRLLTPRLALPRCGITKRGVIDGSWMSCPLHAHKTQNTGATREFTGYCGHSFPPSISFCDGTAQSGKSGGTRWGGGQEGGQRYEVGTLSVGAMGPRWVCGRGQSEAAPGPT